jgi:hypothetical protein
VTYLLQGAIPRHSGTNDPLLLSAPHFGAGFPQRLASEGAVAVVPAACATNGHTEVRRQKPKASAAPSAVDQPGLGSPEGARRSGGCRGAEPPMAPTGGPSVHNKQILSAGGSQWTAKQSVKRRSRSKKRRRYSRQGHALPPVMMRRGEWTRAVQEAMRAEAEAMPHGKQRRAMLRKATALGYCGVQTRVRQCACGSCRPGSGVQHTPDAGKPCNCRSCSLCARRRAQIFRHELAATMTRIEPRKGWSWKHIVVQTSYRPTDPNEVTVDALRARVRGVTAAVRAAWRVGLGQSGAGLRFAVEIAGSGFVHVHAIYWGPYIAKKWLEDVLSRAYAQIGMSWIEEIGGSREEQVKAILEVAKYTTKAPSPLSEHWFEDAREVIHPALAARWELATSAIQLTGQLGVMRGSAREGLAEAEEQDREEKVEEQDRDLPCEQCGVVGEWRWTKWSTEKWVRYCHDAGLRAFAASRWGPTWGTQISDTS